MEQHHHLSELTTEQRQSNHRRYTNAEVYTETLTKALIYSPLSFSLRRRTKSRTIATTLLDDQLGPALGF